MSDAAINFFKADRRSLMFTLFEHFKVQELFESEYYGHLSQEECEAVLDQVLRFADEMIGPINGTADRVGCILGDNEVKTPDGFQEAWKKLYELGMPNFMMPLESGGFQGPSAMNVVIGEVMSGANTSFFMYPTLTHGAMELIETFGLEAEKARFVEVCYLLIYGELPDSGQLEHFSNRLTRHTLIHEDMKKFFEGYPQTAHPMAILSSMVSSLSAYYAVGAGEKGMDLNIVRLLAKAKTIAAFSYKKSMGQPIVYPRNDLTYTQNFLYMMSALPVEPSEVSPVLEKWQASGRG